MEENRLAEVFEEFFTDWRNAGGRYGLEIIRVANGFIITDLQEGEQTVYEDVDDYTSADEPINAMESLLWFIIEHFGMGGSSHSKERLRVIREPGERYEGE